MNLWLDRISSLADDLLIHILSFLPTHFAVRTSVLSKRWRHIWTFMENLHFDDRLWRYRMTSPLGNSATNNPTIDHTFDSFVEQILYRNQNPLLKFRLHCSKLHDFSRINGWIESAVERKVREIDLFLTERFSGQLTPRICTCETLVVLRMRMPTNCNLHIPTNAAAFPSLKILHVSVAVTSSLMEELFSKCPVLEELQIDGITRLHKNVFRIYVPTLKRIAIKIARRNSFTYFHCFYVMAPALEYIDINDDTISIYTLNQHSLLKAKVDVGGGAAEFLSDANHPAIRPLGIRALGVLHVVDSAKFLSLSASTICLLNCDWIQRRSLLETFPNLTHLELQVYGGFDWERAVVEFLKGSPNLKVFVLHILKGPNVYIRKWSVTQQFEPEFCLLLHLKLIEIRGMKGRKNELQLLKYLLKNSQVLEKMIIDATKFNPKEAVCKKVLLLCPRGRTTTSPIKFL